MPTNLKNDRVAKRLEDFSLHALPKKEGLTMCAKFYTIFLLHMPEK